jgi:outer membrane receptor protein involved in Fe transport
MTGKHQLKSRLLASLAVCALAPAAALAQTAPQGAPRAPASPTPAQKGSNLSGVTVQGAPQAAVRTSIDRKSYSVSGDLRGANGSIADALRNLPGAEVDVNGNLSLRGGPVQIMIDGQPSQLFNGPAGAQVLQAMPADRIDRVEVIANPTAAFSPEGGAGIINLVTKKTAPGGVSGGVRANYGSSGHANGAGNLLYAKGKLTVVADGGVRRDPQKLDFQTNGVIADPVTGQPDTRRQHEQSTAPLESWNLHGAASYQLDSLTTLSADARFNTVGLSRNDDFTFLTAAPGGTPLSVYSRDGSNELGQKVAIGQLVFRRQFDKKDPDHNLVAFFNHTQTNYRGETPSTNLITVPSPPVSTYQDQLARVNADVNEFKADYTRPMPRMAQLKTGYDLRTINALFNNFGYLGSSVATASLSPLFTNLFRYGQVVNAGYVTYEQPFGPFTVLGGLRLEDEQLHLDQITQGVKVDRNDFEVFPTLHLAYKQSAQTQWTLNYSERIQRPSPQDLNPWLNLTDPFNPRRGNPDLRDQVTYSVEGGWNWRKGVKSYQATLFYRQSEHGVTDVVTPLTPGVLLTTRENQSSGRNAGLELVAAAPLTKTIDYNVSTDVYWNQITAPLPAGPEQTRQNWTASGRGNINWNVTKNDLIQASAQVNAGRLTPQGHVDPLYVMYFGYRHKFTPDLALVAQAQDPFDLVRQISYLESPGLNQKTVIKAHIQSFLIGFTWTFGGRGRPQRDPGFDFNAAPAAIPGG